MYVNMDVLIESRSLAYLSKQFSLFLFQSRDRAATPNLFGSLSSCLNTTPAPSAETLLY